MRMLVEQRARMEKLKDACDKHVQYVTRYRKRFTNAAVNWADLACVDAGITLSLEEGEREWVLIEEADPDNREIGELISKRLETDGFHDIEVIFAW